MTAAAAALLLGFCLIDDPNGAPPAPAPAPAPPMTAPSSAGSGNSAPSASTPGNPAPISGPAASSPASGGPATPAGGYPAPSSMPALSPESPPTPPPGGSGAFPRPTGTPRTLAMAIDDADDLLRKEPAPDAAALMESGVFKGEYEVRLINPQWRRQDDGSETLDGTMLIDRGPVSRYLAPADQQALDSAQRGVVEAQQKADRQMREFDSRYERRWNQIHKYYEWVNKFRSSEKYSERDFAARRAQAAAEAQRAIAEAQSKVDDVMRRGDYRAEAMKRHADSVHVVVHFSPALLASPAASDLRKAENPVVVGEVVGFKTFHAGPDRPGAEHVAELELTALRLPQSAVK